MKRNPSCTPVRTLRLGCRCSMSQRLHLQGLSQELSCCSCWSPSLSTRCVAISAVIWFAVPFPYVHSAPPPSAGLASVGATSVGRALRAMAARLLLPSKRRDRLASVSATPCVVGPVDIAVGMGNLRGQHSPLQPSSPLLPPSWPACSSSTHW